MPDYSLHRNDEGRLDLILRESDQSIITQNDNDADYQAFKTWANAQTPALNFNKYEFPKNHKLINSKTDFIDWCKATGFRLLAYLHQSSGNWSISTKEEPADNYGKGPMVRLHEAIAAQGPTLGSDGIGARDSRIWISETLFNELHVEVNSKDENDVQRVSTRQYKRAFVYIDISDFSKFPAGQEALVVNSLIQILSYKTYWNLKEEYEYAFCIGDGYIFAFKNAFNATTFAAQLARLIDVFVAKRLVSVKFHFRMGVHVGSVYSFWDIGRKDWNYIGDAINGGNRVLSAVGKETDDVIYVSDDVRHAIMRENDASTAYRELLGSMTNKGRHKDKHGNPWRVFEVNYMTCTSLHPDLELHPTED